MTAGSVPPDGEATVCATVTNSGDVAGEEVAQLYVGVVVAVVVVMQLVVCYIGETVESRCAINSATLQHGGAQRPSCRCCDGIGCYNIGVWVPRRQPHPIDDVMSARSLCALRSMAVHSCATERDCRALFARSQ